MCITEVIWTHTDATCLISCDISSSEHMEGADSENKMGLLGLTASVHLHAIAEHQFCSAELRQLCAGYDGANWRQLLDEMCRGVLEGPGADLPSCLCRSHRLHHSFQLVLMFPPDSESKSRSYQFGSDLKQRFTSSLDCKVPTEHDTVFQ